MNVFFCSHRPEFPGSSSPERFRQCAASPAAANIFYVTNPYSTNGFAPPPSSRHNRMLNINPAAVAAAAKGVRCEMKSMAIYDTSGIESMAPSSISERDEAARAAVFQKARMLSCSGASSSSGGRRATGHRHHDFTSLPLVPLEFWPKFPELFLFKCTCSIKKVCLFGV
ncbi:unnamed protein product [Gongylonema pulchrum]|uniref:Uncharacterized protein n=1 Tax=Gongylonema pulchrum TaxID=637853 RepID=A0A183D7S6_9BILA|nr:unnamed protein product [Gongylonema pulchrum]